MLPSASPIRTASAVVRPVKWTCCGLADSVALPAARAASISGSDNANGKTRPPRCAQDALLPAARQWKELPDGNDRRLFVRGGPLPGVRPAAIHLFVPLQQLPALCRRPVARLGDF